MLSLKKSTAWSRSPCYLSKRQIFSFFRRKKEEKEMRESAKRSAENFLVSGSTKLPVLGLGTWQSSPDTVERAVHCALGYGYRHFDTAYVYHNEKAIGAALYKSICEGKIKREDVFITTKLPNFGMNPDQVKNYLYASLQNLGLTYVDLYLINFPVAVIKEENADCMIPDLNSDLTKVWKAMEEEVVKGYIKSIGVSNFNLRQIENILRCSTVKPACVQVEMHVYCQQKELLSFCKGRDIAVCAYAPLGSRSLYDFLKKCGNSCAIPPSVTPLTDPVVHSIARKRRKCISQILLRYLVQLGVAVIPKSVNPERIKINSQIFNFELSEEEMKQLADIDKGNSGRQFDQKVWKGLENHPEFPFVSCQMPC